LVLSFTQVAYWRDDKDISSPSIIIDCLKSMFNESILDSWMTQKIHTSEVKIELTKTTNDALSMGAFGAPCIIANKRGGPLNSNPKIERGQIEMFFGSDRIEFMAAFLNLPWYGPVPPQKNGHHQQHQKDDDMKLKL